MPRRVSTGVDVTQISNAENKTEILKFPVIAKVKNPAAVALGKLGGSKGGFARAAKLSPEARKAIAQQAAQARWAKEGELK